MDKLYKLLLLFVGLTAMNLTVQAQLKTYSTDLIVENDTPNLYLTESTVQLGFTTESFSFTGSDLISSTLNRKQAINFTNYPNPAITFTTIGYTLTSKASVNLRVIDLAGKQLAVLVKQDQAAGKQEFYWELSKNNITSGMYILLLTVDGKTYSRKIIVQ